STLTEINVPSTGGSYPSSYATHLTPVGSFLYFTVNDSTQLWQYDGTTVTEVSINPSGPSDPSNLSAIGNTLYLSANDGSHGLEPWVVVGHLSTQVVNTNDSGPGSLRQALLNANAVPGTDTITFAIGAGLRTIRPSSALPTIAAPVI